MHREQRRHRLRLHSRATAVAASAALLGGVLSVAGMTATSQAAAVRPDATNGPAPTEASCHLGNGVTHVIRIGFDNVHFFRDNPNVPSDLQMMPNLLNFFENNGTFLSNSHTPLIAHTADDLLTTATGLYGDRQGMPISNSYQAYNTDGTTDPAGSFAYWTDPVFDTASQPEPGPRHEPVDGVLGHPAGHHQPGAGRRTRSRPRRGCRTPGPAVTSATWPRPTRCWRTPRWTSPRCSARTRPRPSSWPRTRTRFKDAEISDYVGLGVHCAQGSTFCSSATGVKFGQTQPSPTASPDVLPDEPGGYSGFQVLFGHRYVAPQIGAGQPNVSHNGFQVTNAAGNLVDENGNQINGAFTGAQARVPRVRPDQRLADARLHGGHAGVGRAGGERLHRRHPRQRGPSRPDRVQGRVRPRWAAVTRATWPRRSTTTTPSARSSSGSPRTASPRQNTLFVLSSDEGDHEAGANVGRAVQPTPANCDGATVNGDTVTPDVPCTYPAGKFGELSGNINQILATETHDTTPFSLESDSAPEFYVTGNPGENDAAGPHAGTGPGHGDREQPVHQHHPADRQLHGEPVRDGAGAHGERGPGADADRGDVRPAGLLPQQRDRDLHRARRLHQSVNPRFAYNHGDYAAEIDTNYIGLAGPGVKHLGLDGSGPTEGPNSAGPDSGQITVPNEHTRGTWADETDIRPTTAVPGGPEG